MLHDPPSTPRGAPAQDSMVKVREVRLFSVREGPHFRREDPPVPRLQPSPRPISSRQIVFLRGRRRQDGKKTCLHPSKAPDSRAWTGTRSKGKKIGTPSPAPLSSFSFKPTSFEINPEANLSTTIRNHGYSPRRLLKERKTQKVCSRKLSPLSEPRSLVQMSVPCLYH